MRLLNTRTICLESFAGNCPEYAILSHTWGGEEVSLQQIHLPEAEKMRGYQKIHHCCKQALSDGIEYLWVDTCCIDKSSSAELSEAINSMFTWYKRSATCYAYLEDVTDPYYAENESYYTYKPNGEPSRWYTRGWTLQELLAPRRIAFYNRSWRKIGTRTMLHDEISHITGIDSIDLIRFGVRPTSIARKMSWIAKRQTTRVEDMAYSLLGIFGIHMPLLYGEGTNAFRRLQEELIKTSADRSIFAWVHDIPRSSVMPVLEPSEKPPLHGVLASSPVYFAACGPVSHCPSASTRTLSPYTMTNTGLRITLPLIDLSTDMSLKWVCLIREEALPIEIDWSQTEKSRQGKYLYGLLNAPFSPALRRRTVIAVLDCFGCSEEGGISLGIILSQRPQDLTFRRDSWPGIVLVDLKQSPEQREEEIIVACETEQPRPPGVGYGILDRPVAYVVVRPWSSLRCFRVMSSSREIERVDEGTIALDFLNGTAVFDLEVQGQQFSVLFYRRYVASDWELKNWMACGIVKNSSLVDISRDGWWKAFPLVGINNAAPDRTWVQSSLGNGLIVTVSALFTPTTRRKEEHIIFIDCSTKRSNETIAPVQPRNVKKGLIAGA
jgi:Heterokaryon incompatibility protein (HET)